MTRELLRPGSLDEALARLAAEPGQWQPLAGGTDVMILLALGKLPERRLIDVWGLAELKGIEVVGDAITFGANTTYREVQAHPLVAAELPMLGQAASETGGWAIQNRGTLGGNIANGSPAADSPPALLAYGAQLELRSQRGARWLAYDTFHTGYKKMALAPDELITRIRVPRPRGRRVEHYRKVGPRRAQAIAKVCFAGCAELEDGQVTAVRIALGGVAPVVLRCPRSEEVVRTEWRAPGGADRAAETLAGEISPIDDIRSSARYRQRVAGNLIRQLVARLLEHVSVAD